VKLLKIVPMQEYLISEFRSIHSVLKIIVCVVLNLWICRKVDSDSVSKLRTKKKSMLIHFHYFCFLLWIVGLCVLMIRCLNFNWLFLLCEDSFSCAGCVLSAAFVLQDCMPFRSFVIVHLCK